MRERRGCSASMRRSNGVTLASIVSARTNANIALLLSNTRGSNSKSGVDPSGHRGRVTMARLKASSAGSGNRRARIERCQSHAPPSRGMVPKRSMSESDNRSSRPLDSIGAKHTSRVVGIHAEPTALRRTPTTVKYHPNRTARTAIATRGHDRRGRDSCRSMIARVPHSGHVTGAADVGRAAADMSYQHRRHRRRPRERSPIKAIRSTTAATLMIA